MLWTSFNCSIHTARLHIAIAGAGPSAKGSPTKHHLGLTGPYHLATRVSPYDASGDLNNPDVAGHTYYSTHQCHGITVSPPSGSKHRYRHCAAHHYQHRCNKPLVHRVRPMPRASERSQALGRRRNPTSESTLLLRPTTVRSSGSAKPHNLQLTSLRLFTKRLQNTADLRSRAHP
jgi:hypothetical protein